MIRTKHKPLLNAREKYAKLYWKMLKNVCGIKRSNIHLDTFEADFKTVNSPGDPFFVPDEDVLPFNERYENNEFCVMFEELNVPFTSDELLKSIKQLKTNKASGPDMNLNEFFINCKNVFSSPC